MKTPRSLIVAVLGVAALGGMLGMPRQTNAQAPAPPVPNANPDDANAIAAVAAEIAKQQAAILENQKAMDAKLAIIAENLRIAKIYVSRGGGSNIR
jgi:hypothetical protein